MNRKYELKERARRQAQTRERIVEAAVALHTSVGPARTTISGIAERAGVERHTVYAHFPDDRSLFRACSAHWGAQHPLAGLRGRWPRSRTRYAASAGRSARCTRGTSSVEADLALFLRDASVVPRPRGGRRRDDRGLRGPGGRARPGPGRAARASERRSGMRSSSRRGARSSAGRASRGRTPSTR